MRIDGFLLLAVAVLLFTFPIWLPLIGRLRRGTDAPRAGLSNNDNLPTADQGGHKDPAKAGEQKA
jgi:hypothetical protein